MDLHWFIPLCVRCGSCLTTAPHWKKTAMLAGPSSRKPLGHVNAGTVVPQVGVKGGAIPAPTDESE